MDCSTVWRLYDKLTASETKGFLFSVLSKYELKPDSVVPVCSRASEDLAAVIGSIFLSFSHEDVLLTIEEARDWLTLAVASAARDGLRAAFERQQNFFCSSSLILPAAPHLSELIITTLRDMPFPLGELSLQSLNSAVSLSLAPALYRLLLFDKELFSHLWDWGDVVYLLGDSRSEIRWYAIEIVSLLMNLPEHSKLKLRSSFVPNEEESACLSVGLGELVESWSYLRQTVCHHSPCQREEAPNVVDSSPWLPVVSITGIHLTVPSHLWEYRMLNGEDTPLVLVPSSSRNLQSLVLALLSQRKAAVLLEGPVGSGKTLLVQHLAALLGRSHHPFLIKVQLGGHTDSKALIGTYQCSDIPGEFVWQAGPLTEAVRKGYWILLEDVDCAPAELTSVLMPLIETGRLAIPGHGATVKAAPGFQLIATQRSLCESNPLSFGGQLRHTSAHWSRVLLATMKKDELVEVVMTRFPCLRMAACKLVEVFSLLSSGSLEATVDFVGARSWRKHLSLRDLIKLCKRLSSTIEGQMMTATVALLQEVIDCFLAYTPTSQELLSAALPVGSLLGFNADKVRFICSTMKPSVEVSETHITIGRATVTAASRKTPSERYGPIQSHTFTRHALVLMERLAVCVHHYEPVLLVGETGTGKTSAVQHLARLTGHNLTVLNMSQQSDSSDLLGGFRPVDLHRVVERVKDHFLDLFGRTFSVVQNVQFLRHIQESHVKNDWKTLLKLMHHCFLAGEKRAGSCSRQRSQWHAFGLELQQLIIKLQETRTSFAFDFVEGKVVEAVKTGGWILLDEINLATSETLDCLSGLLEEGKESVVLLEKGELQPITRHSDFRLFACMNPATDIGKQYLPVGIRNRFTEIFVTDMSDPTDLNLLVSEYLQSFTLTPKQLSNVVDLYIALRDCAEKKLVDIAGHKPHYNLRTFCRALNFAVEVNCGSFLRSLYEGFCFSFTSQLDRASHATVVQLVGSYLIHSGQMLKQPIPQPQPHNDYVNVEGYWLKKGYRGTKLPTEYVLTKTVKANLREVARVVCVRRYPVLLQGPTSVGKTSLIHYLADISGYQCIRINNHEHTDLQEYMGCYVADQQGKLKFQEGPLISAMRGGYWVILDELNLAPSDVLEALNRLLDENRELFVTETQEVVKAEPGFMLFATQNPPGQYGGRKLLSQAFRNRFVEIHFDEIPNKELEMILYKRCSLPKSYCSKLVSVMKDLQAHRRGSGVFAGKYGFITLRDLFRWAQRYKMAVVNEQFYDWEQHLAEDGYMLLAGRVRNTVEEGVVRQAIEKHFRRTVSTDCLFGVCSQLSDIDRLSPLSAKILQSVRGMGSRAFHHLVLTQSLRRVLVLVGRASLFQEPVLLVGETGCGKTTVCQLFAAIKHQQLFTVNCHMHTEAADFLGSLRPVRSHSVDDDCNVRLFEWKHGPLVLSMMEGGSLLIDEISLADDSVLERLNSVLEPERKLLLAERTTHGIDNESLDITAHSDFLVFATMNPGGDFGKKELSAALRNRFTEIWCPGKDDPADLLAIIEHNLRLSQSGYNIGERMLDFVKYWIAINPGSRPMSVRDLLSWVEFINVCNSSCLCHIQPEVAYVHGACLVFVDGLGTFSGLHHSSECAAVKQKTLEFLFQQVPDSAVCYLSSPGLMTTETNNRKTTEDVTVDESKFGIYPFFIKRGQYKDLFDQMYSFGAPTTCQNVFRLLRALQLPKPILLEGSPGVGKTSLVLALAAVSGHRAVRINLSEQTDIGDLFGTDLPTEGGKPGEFSWRDGPLLSALKAGDWIILDELNLASQSVLEGLNACLDHRSEVYVPELGMTFSIQHEKTRIFGCQNPACQGGNRKSLPKSFLNRFTSVFLEEMDEEDFLFILQGSFHDIEKSVLLQMIKFNMQVHNEVVKKQQWGGKGGPWEFNLRDLFRWCQLMLKHQWPGCWKPSQFVDIIYRTKFRTREDRLRVGELAVQVFGDWPCCSQSGPYITSLSVKMGTIELLRTGQYTNTREEYHLLHRWLKPMNALVQSLDMGWMTILVGSSGVGKSSLVRTVAQLTGHHLLELPIISDMDTTDLLGGFEQADLKRELLLILDKLQLLIQGVLQDVLVKLDSRGFGGMDKFLSLISGLLSAKSALGSLSNMLSTDEILDKLESLVLSVSQLLPSLESLYPDMLGSLDELKHALVLLKDKIATGGNNRGVFKWVDSTLVHAVREGYWLLMDNANFCSASVLDRINPLLEPNGKLRIDEIGVIDGDIVTVTPHKDFRLILTVDCTKGELSRAFRNRGIEIYMLGEEENDGQMDSEDIKELLLHCRVQGSTLQGWIFQLLNVLHPLSLSHGSLFSATECVLTATKLLGVLLARGVDCFIAVQTAFEETFHSDRLNPEIRSTVRQLLDAAYAELPLALASSPMADVVAQPTSIDCVVDSGIAMIRRDCHLLLNIIACHSGAVPVIQRLLPDVPTTQLKEESLLFQAVVLFSEKTSPSDFIRRFLWLEGKIARLGDGVRESELFRMVKTVKDSIMEMFTSSLYIELRGQLKSSNPIECCPVGVMTKFFVESRRLFILWHYLLDKSRMRCLSTSVECPAEGSILAYGVTGSGQMASKALAHSCIPHLVKVLVAFDHYIMSWLNQAVILSEEQAVQVDMSLKWYWRLQFVCCQEPGLHPNIGRIGLHWQLFKTQTIDSFESKEPRVAVPVDLATASAHLDKALHTSSDSAFIQWQKCFGVPLPFRSGTIAQAFTKLESLSLSLQEKTSYMSSLIIKEIADTLAALLVVAPTASEVEKQSLAEKALSLCCSGTVSEPEDRKIVRSSNLQRLYDIDCLNLEARIVSRVLRFVLCNEGICNRELYRNLTQEASYVRELNFSSATTLITSLANYLSLETAVMMGDGSQLKSHLPGVLVSLHDRLAACSLLNSLGNSSKQPDIMKDGMESIRQNFDVLDPCVRSVCVIQYLREFLDNFWTNCPVSAISHHISLENYKGTVDELCRLQTHTWVMSYSLDIPEFSYRNLLWIRLAALTMEVVLAFPIVPECCQEVVNQLKAAAQRASSSHDTSKRHLAHTILKGVASFQDLALQLTRKKEELLLTCLKCLLWMLSFDRDADAQLAVLGQGLVSCGLLRLLLLTPDTSVDLKEAEKCKLDWVKEELRDKYNDVLVRQAQDVLLNGRTNFPSCYDYNFSGNSFAGIENSCCPQLESYILVSCINLLQIVHELEGTVAYRPETSQFLQLVADMQHFTRTVGSCVRVLGLVDKLSKANAVSWSCSDITDKEARNFLQSSSLLLMQLQKSYPCYRDVMLPFSASLAQVIEGIQTLMCSTRSQSFSSDICSPVVSALCQLSGYQDLLCSAEVLINTPYSKLTCEQSLCQVVTERGLLTALFQIQTACELSGWLTTQACDVMQLNLTKFVQLWQAANEEESKAQASQLYTYRTKKHLSDELLEHGGGKDKFERTSDFEDILHEETLGCSNCDALKCAYPVLKAALTVDLYVKLSSIHHLIYTRSVWRSWLSPGGLNPKGGIFKTGSLRDVLMSGYKTVVMFGDYLRGTELDCKLSCSHLLAVNDQLKSLTCPSEITIAQTTPLVAFQNGKAPYDIYSDSNIVEALSVGPVLEHFVDRVVKLLENWPENPLLCQLLQIVNRIKSFPVTSPLTKFLAGLELLLQKSQDWESCTATQYSLREELNEIAQVVLQWRKMELKSWPSVLATVAWKHACKASRWWFHLYQIVQPYLDSLTSYDTNINSVLRQFLETSTLGEFHSRLLMVYAFHCHLASACASSECNPVVCNLWHTFHYYNQFLPSVSDYVLKAQAPIEKQLKDISEIARWSDINYWTLKDSTEKSHRTLHRLARKYEELLSNPVSIVLHERNLDVNHSKRLSAPETAGAAGAKQLDVLTSVLDQLTAVPVQKHKDFIHSTQEICIDDTGELGKYHVGVFQLARKLKKQCRKLITASTFCGHLQTLDKLFGMTSQLQELLKMDHGDNVSQGKIKYQTQHKRVLLSTLFKALKTVGLSYRRGNRLRLSGGSQLQCFLLSAVDMEAAAKQFVKVNNGIWSQVHLQTTFQSWASSHQYFYMSVAEMAGLDAVLSSPSKDVNFHDLGKMSGYGTSLADLICNQHQTVGKFVLPLLTLCSLLDPLMHLFDECPSCDAEVALPSQSGTHHWMMTLKDLVDISLLRLQQFMLVLECYPLEEGLYEAYTPELPLYSQCCGYVTFAEGREKIKTVSETVGELKCEVDELVLPFLMDKQREWTRLITKSDFGQVEAAYGKFAVIAQQLSIALEMLQGEAKWRGNGGLLAPLRNVYDHITTTVSQYMQWQEASMSHCFENVDGNQCVPGTLDEFSSSVNYLATSVLKAVQHLVSSQNSDDGTDCTKGDILDIQKHHLTDLHDKTTARLHRLRIDEICQAVQSVTSSIQTAADQSFFSSTPEGKKIILEAVSRLSNATPLLATYAILASWFLYESIAAHAALCHLLVDMLCLFATIVAKGFGTPVKDVENPAGDGEVDFEGLDPAGMGEGEGIKDVSDQIESEDQLLDINQAGDCGNQQQDELGAKGEEEHAVEMSDDIDAPFVDDEQRPLDEADEESDDTEDSSSNEIGQRMGEIGGPGEEELDKRMWASDSEDEIERPLGDEQNRKGGSQASESQLVAKGSNQVNEDQNQEENQPKNEQDDAVNMETIEELHREEDMNDALANPDHHPESEPLPPPPDVATDLPDDIVIDGEDDLEQVGDSDLLDTPNDMDQEEEKNFAHDIDEDTMVDTSKELHGEPEPECLTETSSFGIENMQDKLADFKDVLDTSGLDTSGLPEQCVPQMDSGTCSTAMELPETHELESKEQTGLPTFTSLEKSQASSHCDQEEDISEPVYEDVNEKSRQLGGKVPQRLHFTRSSSNRQQDPGVEPNAKKLKVTDEDVSEFKAECEKPDKGVPVESETYQHLPLDDSGEHDHVTVAGATEDQAKTGVDVVDDDRVLEEQETNYDIEQLKSTTEDDNNTVTNTSIPGTAAQAHESITDDCGVGVSSIVMNAEQQEDGRQKMRSFVRPGTVLLERTKVVDIDALRHELEAQLAIEQKGKSDLMSGAVAAETWTKYSMLTAQLSHELCEQLRLVLEPTQSSRLKGDYRTGKRLNMKKVIPYIASQFRKDKIWLRRTKPSKRQYHIMLAIDDSSSMSDNQSKQMAFEALAVISNALRWLESGQLGVCSFGESARILHQLNEPFTDQSGVDIICQFSFQQKKTRVAEMLQRCVLSMLSAKQQSVGNTMSHSQLLLIISDGRGIFVEGTEVVRSAIRKAHDAGILIVFIILDNPSNKDSVMDIFVPVFHSGQKLPSISSYMDDFPFPFYIVLRDMTCLPETLSDALRQWFEFITDY